MTDLIALAREIGAVVESNPFQGCVFLCLADLATFAARIAKAPEDERKAFEAWVGSLESWIPSIKRGRHGYESNTTAAAWHAWEKRASLPPAHQAGGEGWQLVPITLTGAMIKAGGHSNSEWLNDNAPIGETLYAMPMESVWRAMLKAAPPAPSALAAKGVE